MLFQCENCGNEEYSDEDEIVYCDECGMVMYYLGE